MGIQGYVQSWLIGAGRNDLARKIDSDEMPEIHSEYARDLFICFQRGLITPDVFMLEVFGITY